MYPWNGRGYAVLSTMGGNRPLPQPQLYGGQQPNGGPPMPNYSNLTLAYTIDRTGHRNYEGHQPNNGKRDSRVNQNNDGNAVAKRIKTEPGNAATGEDETHVIFAIDFSSSMNVSDVKTHNGTMSRWDAVFKCVNSFLDKQLQDQDAAQGHQQKAVVSLLIFNNESSVLINRMELVGDGASVKVALQVAQSDNRPRGGTSFSAGFREASRLAQGNHQEAVCDNVVVVFLTDGRPGDLRSYPPMDSSIAMQATYRDHGKEYRSAGYYIEMMQKAHQNFNLQLVCLYTAGMQWMIYLSKRYNATLHNPDLSLDEPSIATNHPNSSANSMYDAETKVDEFDAETKVDEFDAETKSEVADEIVELKVKSSNTVIAENFARAKAAGQVVSLTSTTLATSQTTSTSIQSTFDSISESVSVMRASGIRKERQVTVMTNSPYVSFEATRMVLMKDSNGEKSFSIPAGEISNGRRVQVSMHPFAQGGLRNVFRLKEYSSKDNSVMIAVAKESRHEIQYRERVGFHLETALCQIRAYQFGKAFNQEILEEIEDGDVDYDSIPTVKVLCTVLYRLKAPSHPGGFRYLAVENQLQGEYAKYNNNDGWVHASESVHCRLAQAFSHFSYEKSNQKEIVVDIQGAGSIYADPQLHSVAKKYGRADRGGHGIAKFFETHKCNDFCHMLELPDRSKQVLFS